MITAWYWLFSAIARSYALVHHNRTPAGPATSCWYRRDFVSWAPGFNLVSQGGVGRISHCPDIVASPPKMPGWRETRNAGRAMPGRRSLHDQRGVLDCENGETRP